jgi:very-short-patch-repair endonuclease
VHRVTRLAPADVTRYRNIPVTSRARTLVDLAGDVDDRELTRALRETQFQRRFDLQATREALARRPCRALRVLVEDLVLTQTRIEDDLVRICDRYRITRPLTQQPVLGRRVDFLWPRERVIVETDGWEAHGTRGAFQADRVASNVYQLAGYVILRFTAADLRRRPRQVAEQIRAALARSSGG